MQPHGHVGDLRRVDGALPRVAEAHRHVAADRQSLVARAGDDRGEHVERLGDGAVEVALRERLGGAGEHGDLAHAGGQRAVEAAVGRDEHRVAAGQLAEPREQLLGVGELRHPPRRDEAGELDGAQAGVEQAADELGLDLDGDDDGLVLQAVAGADLVDLDALGQAGQGGRHGCPSVPAARHGREQLVDDDLVAGADRQVGDRAGERRGERVLHLHRLHHEQDLTLLHLVAERDPHREDGAGHRAAHVAVVRRRGAAPPQRRRAR